MIVMLSADLEKLPLSARALAVANIVEALVAINVEHARAGRLPGLYDSGVTYGSALLWLDAPSAIRAGSGDCKTLAAWRIAELRFMGVDARVHVEVQSLPTRDELHVKVRTPNGFEDPSERLGMNAYKDQEEKSRIRGSF